MCGDQGEGGAAEAAGEIDLVGWVRREGLASEANAYREGRCLGKAGPNYGRALGPGGASRGGLRTKGPLSA
jgi:hypothetical protein